MARDDDNGKRIEELEQRAAVQHREVVMLADTIKDLVTHVQQLAQAQVRILESHDELLQKIVEMEQRLDAQSR